MPLSPLTNAPANPAGRAGAGALVQASLRLSPSGRLRWIGVPGVSEVDRARTRALLGEGAELLEAGAARFPDEPLWFARAARACSGTHGWSLLWELRLLGRLEAFAVRVRRGEQPGLRCDSEGLLHAEDLATLEEPPPGHRDGGGAPVDLNALWCGVLQTLGDASEAPRRFAWRQEAERAVEVFRASFWREQPRGLRALAHGSRAAGLAGLVAAASDPPVLERAARELVLEQQRSSLLRGGAPAWARALAVEAELRTRELSVTSLRGLASLLARRNAAGADPMKPLLRAMGGVLAGRAS